MSQKKIIRFQIDLPVDEISNDQISNIRFKLSLEAAHKRINISNYDSFKSVSMSSLSSSSVSGYSSASDSFSVSEVSDEFQVAKFFRSEEMDSRKKSGVVYDKLNHRKLTNLKTLPNYSSTKQIQKQRQENIYEEIDECLELESQESVVQKSRVPIKNLKKEYSLNEIFTNLEDLNECAQKQEDKSRFENFILSTNNLTSCSEPVYV
ncbi:unnamed protein product [Brachionus calyciflorus]|uniref:Uncharacterized protein n=1 Tax=Brachionus calyciflorus TaxID=104777 RepID=A0A813YCM5_9BILA|nr:unnamed protein product [Brachionus calyciflorus]